MGWMHVLNEKGHVEINWDVDDKKSVKKAQEEFATLRAAGFEAYVGEGRKKKRVTEFDPTVGTYIIAPGAARKGEAAKPKQARERPKAMAGGPTNQSVRL